MLQQVQYVKQPTQESSLVKDDESTNEPATATSSTATLEELRNEGRMLKEFITGWCKRQEQCCDVLEQGHLLQQQKGPQQPASQDEQCFQQSPHPAYPQWMPPSNFRANVIQPVQHTRGFSKDSTASPADQQRSNICAEMVSNGMRPAEQWTMSLSSRTPESPSRSPTACRYTVSNLSNLDPNCPSNWDRLESDESAQQRKQWTGILKKQVSKDLRRSSSRLDEFRCLMLEPNPFLRKIVESKLFQASCAAVILANSACIGFMVDVGMAHVLMQPMGQDPDWWKHLNIAFTCFYAVEIMIRIAAYRWSFVIGDDKSWNAFDTLLLVLALMETASGTAGVSSMRAQKGLRMFRVLRVIRVLRFFRDLRMMVCFILQSLSSLCWAMILLVVIMYLFTALFMQGIVMHFQDNPGDINILREGAVTFYGSILTTMYTLLAAITGGIDWQEAVAPLDGISPLYRGLWSFYVVFVVIGVLNVLTGIFVERACELNGLDRDLVVQSEMLRNESFLVEMKRIFEEVDEQGVGTISWQSFQAYMQNPRVRAYFSSKQLDAFDVRSLFELFTQDHAEEIGVEDFITGCQQLKGMARSVDLMAVLRESRETKRLMKILLRRMDSSPHSQTRGDVAWGRQSCTETGTWGEGSEVTSRAPEVHCDI